MALLVLTVAGCGWLPGDSETRTTAREFRELRELIDVSALTTFRATAGAVDGRVAEAIGSVAGCGLPSAGELQYTVAGRVTSPGGSATGRDRLATALDAAGEPVEARDGQLVGERDGYRVVVAGPAERAGGRTVRRVSITSDCLSLDPEVAEQLEALPPERLLG